MTCPKAHRASGALWMRLKYRTQLWGEQKTLDLGLGSWWSTFCGWGRVRNARVGGPRGVGRAGCGNQEGRRIDVQGQNPRGEGGRTGRLRGSELSARSLG